MQLLNNEVQIMQSTQSIEAIEMQSTQSIHARINQAVESQNLLIQRSRTRHLRRSFYVFLLGAALAIVIALIDARIIHTSIFGHNSNNATTVNNTGGLIAANLIGFGCACFLLIFAIYSFIQYCKLGQEIKFNKNNPKKYLITNLLSKYLTEAECDRLLYRIPPSQVIS